MVNKWLDIAQFWLLPPVCTLCGRRGTPGWDLCPGCRDELPYIKVACRCCGLPLSTEGVCGQCLQQPPPFERAWAPFEYQAPLDQMIQGLKFGRRLYLGRLLGGLMADSVIPRLDRSPQALLPVPLHRSRLRERGFNQAHELARPAAARLSIPILYDCVRRTHKTRPQPGLDAGERRRNLKGAFEVVRPLPVSHIALVDDVMTTGSTLAALSEVLIKAGVERVDVWVCARAL